MTSPHHDDGDEGEDRLNKLYRMLSKARAYTQEIERRIAEEEGVPNEELVRRRRRMIQGLAVIPGIGGAAALVRAVRPRARDLAVAAGASAVTATVLAVIPGIGSGGGPHRGKPPAAAPPPAVSPSVQRPPDGRPPPASAPPVRSTQAVPIPSPEPEPSQTGKPGGGSGTPPTAVTDPPVTTPGPPGSVLVCRVYLPRLGLCVLPLRQSDSL